MNASTAQGRSLGPHAALIYTVNLSHRPDGRNSCEEIGASHLIFVFNLRAQVSVGEPSVTGYDLLVVWWGFAWKQFFLWQQFFKSLMCYKKNGSAKYIAHRFVPGGHSRYCSTNKSFETADRRTVTLRISKQIFRFHIFLSLFVFFLQKTSR